MKHHTIEDTYGYQIIDGSVSSCTDCDDCQFSNSTWKK